MTYVKVCGLSSPEMARVAVEAGADAVGLVMSAPSPRNVMPDAARAVIAAVAGRAQTVLVVREMPAAEAARTAAALGVDALQLHGSYSEADFAAAEAIFPVVWRATSLARDPRPVNGERGETRLLLDAPQAGGGERWDLAALQDVHPTGEWLLAGGLNPENVGEAIATARPWGVDVSSGVESEPGVKDAERIRSFVAAVRAADERAAG